MHFEPEEIIAMAHENPNMTLGSLAGITGWSESELSALLL